jgi:hypothetical protein
VLPLVLELGREVAVRLLLELLEGCLGPLDGEVEAVLAGLRRLDPSSGFAVVCLVVVVDVQVLTSDTVVHVRRKALSALLVQVDLAVDRVVVHTVRHGLERRHGRLSLVPELETGQIDHVSE